MARYTLSREGILPQEHLHGTTNRAGLNETTDKTGTERNPINQTMPALTGQTEGIAVRQSAEELQQSVQNPIENPGDVSEQEGIKSQSSTITSEELVARFKCGICCKSVSNARLCPNCSKMFCCQCLNQWIIKRSSRNCPWCHTKAAANSWVTGYSINHIVDSVNKLVANMDHRGNGLFCKEHGNQRIMSFCYICEECMCLSCIYSVKHNEHRLSIVPLDQAFNHFQRELKSTVQWASVRKEQIRKEMLEDEVRLGTERERLEELCKMSDAYVDANPHPITLLHIMHIDQALRRIRWNCQDDIQAMRLERGRDMVPKPLELVYRVRNFNKTIANKNLYEMTVKDPYGSEWKCTIVENNFKWGNGADFTVYLSLMRGIPSKYSVGYGNQLSVVHQFELGEKLKIGTFAPSEEADTQVLTIQIYQSYANCIQQLENTVEELRRNLEYAQQQLRSFLLSAKVLSI